LVGSHNGIRGRLVGSKEEIVDPFWRVAQKYRMESVCALIAKENDGADVQIFGELIGHGVQVGYDYGIAPGDLDLRVFDIMINGEYVGFEELRTYCHYYLLNMVVPVYEGPFSQEVLKLCEAVDEFGGRKFRREGIVVKTKQERKANGTRVCYKKINPEYLADKKNSSWH
jgi:RNA ligase (TIGR02306 family)